jgi:hypothetical protein
MARDSSGDESVMRPNMSRNNGSGDSEELLEKSGDVGIIAPAFLLFLLGLGRPGSWYPSQ